MMPMPNRWNQQADRSVVAAAGRRIATLRHWTRRNYAVATDTTTAGARRCLVLNAETKAPATVDVPLSSAGRCGS
jgi:hypothetical protein